MRLKSLLKIFIVGLCILPLHGLGQVKYSRQDMLRDQAKITMEQRRTFFSRLRNDTVEVLQQASRKPNASARAKEIYSKMRERLLTPVFVFPKPGEDFGYCSVRTRVDAYVPSGQDYIVFCPIFIWLVREKYENKRIDLLFLVIHELAHSTNFDGGVLFDKECGADFIANSTLADAGFSLAVRRRTLFGSPYFTNGRCSFSVNDTL